MSYFWSLYEELYANNANERAETKNPLEATREFSTRVLVV